MTSGDLDVVPAARRNEVLGFLAGGVDDVSVSRPADRACGWGVPVPDDPTQVVYVWFDALVNYLSGLGWPGAASPWWFGATERVHVVGKGITRFHAVLWPAVLLSAGLPLPDRVLVHDYLTVDGAKIAKSGAQAAGPADLATRFGIDALRWWLVREPALLSTTDFMVERLVAAHDQDLANGIGNLVARTVTPARGRAVSPAADVPLSRLAASLPDRVDESLARYDLRAAAVAVTDVVAEAGRFLGAEEPWRLARRADAGDTSAGARCDAVLGTLLDVCRVVTRELSPFVPAGAERLGAALDGVDGAGVAFPRIGGARA